MDRPDGSLRQGILVQFEPGLRETTFVLLHRLSRSWVIRTVWLLGLLLFLLQDPTLGNVLFGMWIILAVPAITTFVLAVITHRRLSGPITVHVDEKGVEVETAVARSELRWSFFKAALEARKHYELLAPGAFLWIPKRAFPDAGSEREFRALCERFAVTHFEGERRGRRPVSASP